MIHIAMFGLLFYQSHKCEIKGTKITATICKHRVELPIIGKSESDI